MKAIVPLVAFVLIAGVVVHFFWWIVGVAAAVVLYRVGLADAAGPPRTGRNRRPPSR